MFVLSFSLVSLARNPTGSLDDWAPCDTSHIEAVKSSFKKESTSTRVNTWQDHFDNYVAQHVFQMSQTQLQLMSDGLGFVAANEEITDADWLDNVEHDFTQQERYEIFQSLPEYAPTQQQIADELAEQGLAAAPRCICQVAGFFQCGIFTTATCNSSSTGWPCAASRFGCGELWLQACNGRCYTRVE